MKEAHPVFNVVFDQHATRISFNEFWRRASELIGQQEHRFFVTQVDDGNLSDRPNVIRQCNLLIKNARGLVLTRHTLQINSTPCTAWLGSCHRRTWSGCFGAHPPAAGRPIPRRSIRQTNHHGRYLLALGGRWATGHRRPWTVDTNYRLGEPAVARLGVRGLRCAACEEARESIGGYDNAAKLL